jgi:hypothetical protein
MKHAVLRNSILRACRSLGGFAVLGTLAAHAWAGEGAVPDARVAAARALFTAENGIGATRPAQPAARPGRPEPANTEGLASQRGGAATQNEMRLDGSVAGNTAVNVVTGANSIGTGSFANMSGIPVVIQNSGANVLIQNATIINLQFK